MSLDTSAKCWGWEQSHAHFWVWIVLACSGSNSSPLLVGSFQLQNESPYIINMIPTPVTQNESPYSLIYHKASYSLFDKQTQSVHEFTYCWSLSRDNKDPKVSPRHYQSLLAHWSIHPPGFNRFLIYILSHLCWWHEVYGSTMSISLWNTSFLVFKKTKIA